MINMPLNSIGIHTLVLPPVTKVGEGGIERDQKDDPITIILLYTDHQLWFR